MKAPTRRERILDGLRTAGKVQVAALASELGTSAVTIRRDLAYLATAGDLRRIHGGAVSIMMSGEAHPGVKRGITSAGSEDRLAAAVAALVADGDVIALASGTLCAPVAKAFFGRRLTVMPFSLQATMELIGQPGINLIAPGGSVHPATGAIIGPLAEASARLFRFDTVVLSLGDAVAADGATAYGTQSASLKRTLLTMARKALIVADGSMLSPSILATVHPRPSLDVVITDSMAPVPVVDQLRAEGVEVIVL